MDLTQLNDNDFKYVIGDYSSTQIGARYTYEDILMHERVPFKFQSIVTIYILREMKVLDPSCDTPEKTMISDHLLAIEPGNLIYDTYKRLKLKVRFTAPYKDRYKVYNYKFDKFKDYVDVHGADGIMIQEINISNLALMSFAV